MSKKTKQILSLLVSVIMVFSMFAGINLSVSAEDDVLDYLAYEIIDGKVTITDCDTSISGDVVIPDTIEGYPVTAIGDYAFSECLFLEKIDMPDTVAYIGESSFAACCNLKEIDIPDSVREIGENAFASCFNIKNVSIPNGVTDIKDSVFGACWLLENVDIPNSVTSIGAYAFSACFCLEDLVIPESVTYIEKDAFYGAYGLKNIYINNPETELCENSIYGNMWNLRGITLKEFAVLQTELMIATHTGTLSADEIRIKNEELEQYIGEPEEVPSDLVIHGYNASTAQAYAEANGIAFESFVDETDILDYLTYEIIDGEVTITDCDESISGDIVIPDMIDGYPVTTIGYRAFVGCDELITVELGNNVITIGDTAFGFCERLKTVTIPDSVTYLGQSAFTDCYNLTDITIPDSITVIRENTFGLCYSLKQIDIPDSVTRIECGAFWGCSGLKNIVIPESVEYIGGEAFRNCSYLESADIGASYIDTFAFGPCVSLENVNLTDNVTYIADAAFTDCYALESIKIPESVTYLGMDNFVSCMFLKDIYIYNPELEILTSDSSYDWDIGYTDIEVSIDREEFVETVKEAIRIGIRSDLNEEEIEKYNELRDKWDNAMIYLGEKKIVEDFVIHGHEGSLAENYAKAKNINFMFIGQEEPEVPEIPDVPDVPDVPEEPDVPETPENPEGNETENDFFSSIKAFFEKIAEFFAKIFETLKNLFA